uniref:Neur_chan_memb domain-containing protein n=1 Tax=Meloidogyne hapla TaxID=6305 RepID=A0A1I8BED5_MELHA
MSVDVWIFGSIAFIASSLIELAIVGHLHRKYRSKNFRRKSTLLLEQEQDMLQISSNDINIAENSFMATDNENNLIENNNIFTNYQQKIFNVGYWTYYVGYHRILRQKLFNSIDI